MHREDENLNVLRVENWIDKEQRKKTWAKTGTTFITINLLYLLHFVPCGLTM